ncbi:MAG: aminoacyl-tRNA hydrolase [Patescibacteria group bacterium]
MKFLFGLGNPGTQYNGTRHNAGFAVVDAAVAKWLNHEAFTLVGAEKKKSYESWEFRCHGISCKESERLYCIKPLTYMNKSGDVVSEWLRYAPGEVQPSTDLWVIHDELDILLGKFKIDQNSSSAGHNGVQSIIDVLGTTAFVRFRIGIRLVEAQREPTADFVLKPFTPAERGAMEVCIPQVIDALEISLTEGISRAQQKYHQKEKSSERSLSA